MAKCAECGEIYSESRRTLGYKFCLSCGESIAKEKKHCIVPMNKSNYIVVSDISVLRQLNPKRSEA